MTIGDKLMQAQAVLVLGSDDDTGSIFADPVWLGAGETGGEAFEQALNSSHAANFRLSSPALASPWNHASGRFRRPTFYFLL
jgi:hypothetical protein